MKVPRLSPRHTLRLQGVCRFSLAAILLAIAGAERAAAQSKPVELSLGWNYAYDDQGDGFANANGWYGTLNWARYEHIGFTFSHESYWGGYRNSGLNQHVYLGGITWKPRRGEHRINPFVQPFGGTTRASYGGLVEEQPTFELAAGADVKLHGHLSFEIIPAEYTYAHASIGSLNNYQAGAGFEYTFGGKEKHEKAVE